MASELEAEPILYIKEFFLNVHTNLYVATKPTTLPPKAHLYFVICFSATAHISHLFLKIDTKLRYFYERLSRYFCALPLSLLLLAIYAVKNLLRPATPNKMEISS